MDKKTGAEALFKRCLEHVYRWDRWTGSQAYTNYGIFKAVHRGDEEGAEEMFRQVSIPSEISPIRPLYLMDVFPAVQKPCLLGGREGGSLRKGVLIRRLLRILPEKSAIRPLSIVQICVLLGEGEGGGSRRGVASVERNSHLTFDRSLCGLSPLYDLSSSDALNPKPQTPPNPKPQTLNPKPQTPNPKP
jgi:hypothetical protein